MSLLTRAESSAYRETSLHADVLTFVTALAGKGDRRIHLLDERDGVRVGLGAWCLCRRLAGALRRGGGRSQKQRQGENEPGQPTDVHHNSLSFLRPDPGDRIQEAESADHRHPSKAKSTSWLRLLRQTRVLRSRPPRGRR